MKCQYAFPEIGFAIAIILTVWLNKCNSAASKTNALASIKMIVYSAHLF